MQHLQPLLDDVRGCVFMIISGHCPRDDSKRILAFQRIFSRYWRERAAARVALDRRHRHDRNPLFERRAQVRDFARVAGPDLRIRGFALQAPAIKMRRNWNGVVRYLRDGDEIHEYVYPFSVYIRFSIRHAWANRS